MATPFSPFVGRQMKPALKRRQSELPSDLIDWDAPEIPELEKQRIIYEDYIKELQEDHEVETFLTEQIIRIAHDTIIEEYNSKLKQLKDCINEERSKVNLMLGQIKMFENEATENDGRINELTIELSDLQKENENFLQERESWLKEREYWIKKEENWKSEIENLNFRNNETTCELNHNLEIYIQKKNEAEDFKKKLDAVKNQLAHYKRLAKQRDVNE